MSRISAAVPALCLAAALNLFAVDPTESAPEPEGKRSALANSDPNYRALRDGKLVETYRVENIVLKRDASVITLKSGQISFIGPVLDKHAIAVFSGEGTFHLKPAVVLEANYLGLIAERSTVDEDFDSAFLCFADHTYDEIRQDGHRIDTSAKNESLLHDFRGELRHRTETPRTWVEYMLHADNVPNFEAQVLGELYNPKYSNVFSALIHGKKYPHLRFIVNPHGAIPDMGPEEVALINLDTSEKQDGIWYLTHLENEWNAHVASDTEEKRFAAPEHYNIDARVGRRDRLLATVHIRFRAMHDGDRVIPFDLLPSLRVSRVGMGVGRELGYIQEDRRQDGSFYVIMPEPLKKGELYTIDVEYDGNKVIHNAGNGNYSVGARTSWYPTVAAFHDRATYDITFQCPRHFTLVSVGKMVHQDRDGDVLTTEWKSDVPLAVAGFNYGDYKRKDRNDTTTKYSFESYATSEVPDYLKNASRDMAMTPSAMADSAMVDALNSVRIFERWFGELPYGRLAITQQPEFNFGQSWPTLVYLPVSAFLDSTHRWRLMGENAFKFSDWIQEVTPHEVSHQWWGHMVGWASYHDQWLSEGFADFSAGLFLQNTEQKPDKYLKYWENARKMITDKNEFGRRPNDAGPLWMGLRLNTYKTEGAYRRIVYPKGGYVLHMLRYLMQEPDTGDQRFIDMMHDFVTTYTGKTPCTEDFMHMVEKHMGPDLDFDKNQSMAWFFREWVYGTELPSYRLEYSLTAAAGGKTQVTAHISQQGVSPAFKMRVPLYADFDGRMAKLGTVPMAGSMTSSEIKVLLPQKPRRLLLNANYDILATSVSTQQI